MKSTTTLCAAVALAFTASHASAAFVYHDTAATTGGVFNGSFPLSNLKNAGHTSHLDQENAADNSESYATKSPPTGGFPVTITLDFTDAVNLSNFYLWNHSNNSGGGAPANGVGDFNLTFYSGAGGTGSQIGSVFSGLGTAAPATGLYAAQDFAFGSTYLNVRSVEFEIIDKANNTASGFLAMREIGFESQIIPEPSSALLLGFGLGGFLLRRRR